jgi:hypothetical protein
LTFLTNVSGLVGGIGMRGMAKNSEGQYSNKEAEKRFKAALRGARVTGHKSKESIPPKRVSVKKKKR